MRRILAAACRGLVEEFSPSGRNANALLSFVKSARAPGGTAPREPAVFDAERIPDTEWKDIPTVKEALGADIQYQMLRGIFGAPEMPKDAVDWYAGFLKKVYDTPEFQDYLHKGALKAAFATGAEYVKWVEGAEQLHKDLMTKGGLLKK